MINTPYISKLIREGNFNEIRDIMEKGSDKDMKTFDMSLLELYKTGKIDMKSALANADSSSELEWKINFGGGLKQEQKQKEASSDILEFPDSNAKQEN